ncbi:S53 family peptidase [Microbacterium kribbense]|uniref:S53 family peptidase n=1 Tax=Microbacterium kribbense TaxID=433645 RepID=A0ABP7G2M8_9MICO
MTGHEGTPLPGSSRPTGLDAQLLGPLPDDEQVTATLVLRRRAEPDAAAGAPATAAQLLTAGQLADRYGADPADIETVQSTLRAAGIDIVQVDAATRRIRVSGTAATMNSVFGIHLLRSNQGADSFRHHADDIALPPALAGIVTAVLGLDDRPQARAHSRRVDAAAISYTPIQVGEAYSFPPGTDGTGQHLAIIELGGGYATDDLHAYFDGLGVPLPAVSAVGVDGAANSPGTDPNSDGEVMLDIEVAGALAPAAEFLVYFAPNTDAGFLDAIAEAYRADTAPTAMSISWGQSEDQWTPQARTAMDQALADAALRGVTVTVAAGDNGSGDRGADGSPHVDFPASSPHALGCGGTSLPNPAGEAVWNDGSSGGATGGGVSDAFALPAWQSAVGVPVRATSGGGAGRGVPDVAGDADPQTGYQVRVDGQSAVYGGTSAVAPLWAALICRLAQAAGRPFGLLQPTVYAGVSAGQAPAGFRDITAGDNGAYSAGPGWDACTGLGVPVGTALLTALTA